MPHYLLISFLACAPDSRDAHPGGLDPAAEAPTLDAVGVSPAPPVQGAEEDPTSPSFENPPMTSVPLLGGTLEAVPDLDGVLAADPEGDRLIFVPGDAAPVDAWATGGDADEIPLGANARPFRVEVVGTRAWVTLRGTGEVAAIDVGARSVTWRAKVCPEPRGLDHADDGSLVVACAGGDLVGLDDATGEILRRRVLPSDLRDVVTRDGLLYVSRFRPGEVLLVDEEAFTVLDVAPLGVTGRDVWRMRLDTLDDSGVLAVFDEVSTDTIEASDGPSPSPSGSTYGGDSLSCNARHQPTFARVLPEGYAQNGGSVRGAVLPVDFAITSRDHVLLINGGGSGQRPTRNGLIDLLGSDALKSGTCALGSELQTGRSDLPSAVTLLDGEIFLQKAAAATVQRTSFSDLGVFQTLWSSAEVVSNDDPRLLFHRDPGSGVACASCHPEGQDDGQVWRFGAGVTGVDVAGLRRTLPLAGRVRERAPFHWMGELTTPEALMMSTFTLGMGGPLIAADDTEALFDWLEGLRPVRRTSDADAETLAQGAEAFEIAGCSGCHAGPELTDDRLEDVRADGPTKTPTLVGLGMHTSFMHDGCAATILDRLTGPESCTGGDRHGAVSSLSDAQVQALAAYLETL